MDLAALKLLLPPEVILVPVADLSDSARRQIGTSGAGDYAISRLHGRILSKIVDSDTALLLEQFRSPKTLVEAVIAFAAVSGADPEATLEAAFPILKHLAGNQLLVESGSKEAADHSPSLKHGDRCAGLDVIHCVQLLDDTEVYRARRANGEPSALKICRADASRGILDCFSREAAVLRHLNGVAAPLLHDAGTFEERPYLVLEWCSGIHVDMAAIEARRSPGDEGRMRLLDLACAILQAYASIHARDVIHSDVHPRNIIVLDSGAISVIDFGLASIGEQETGYVDRGGVGFYLEPEYAVAALKHQSPPPSTFASEQYALAAVLYQLFTGEHYLDFSVEKQAMMQQIAEGLPLPFLHWGLRPWPLVEQSLGKALSKTPSERFPSLTEFRSSLLSARDRHDERENSLALAPPGQAAATELLQQWLVRLQSLPELPPAPTASINHGLGGMAYALYRLALMRNSASLLAHADCLATKAAAQIGRVEAFYSPEDSLTEGTIGSLSLYHTDAGIHCLRGLIAQAMGDGMSWASAAELFIQASSKPCHILDLTLGQAGILVGCAMLYESIAGLDRWVETKRLDDFGANKMVLLWQQIDGYGALPQCPALATLGMAHGWAGILYATLRWCSVSTSAVPPGLPSRLEQLANCAEPAGKGLRWRWVIDAADSSASQGSYVSGWCNGSAGMVHLWVLAHRMLRRDRCLDLAYQSAWNTWEELDRVGDLCCGYAGRAYALLNLYKYTGENVWLTRACELAYLAASSIKQACLRRDSLYKGELGVALLLADIENPKTAAMPFFESEGWGPLRTLHG